MKTSKPSTATRTQPSPGLRFRRNLLGPVPTPHSGSWEYGFYGSRPTLRTCYGSRCPRRGQSCLPGPWIQPCPQPGISSLSALNLSRYPDWPTTPDAGPNLTRL